MRSLDSHFTVTSPVPSDVWESVFKSDPGSVVTQSPEWHDAVISTGQYKDISMAFEFGSGHQVVVPMAQRRWRTPLDLVAGSWPHRWGVGGPMCRDGRIDPGEAAAVLGHVARHGILGGEIHLSHAAPPVWLEQARRFRVVREPCYVIDLSGGFEEVWRHKFQRTVRQAVRKAESSGMDIQADRSGKMLDTFYDLYERSMSRWSNMAHEPLWFTKWNIERATPKSMLTAVAERFGESCTTWVARSGGDPVAVIIVLQAGWHCIAWKAAMDKERAGPLRAFQLLHRLAIEEACEAGCRIYDMQVANPGTSLASSKKRLGAELRFTHYVQAERLPVHSMTDFSKNLVRKRIFRRA